MDNIERIENEIRADERAKVYREIGDYILEQHRGKDPIDFARAVIRACHRLKQGKSPTGGE